MNSEQKLLKDYLFVGLQLILLFIYILPINLIRFNLINGLYYFSILLMLLGFSLSGIALLQINTKLSPFPTPKLNTTLHTNGAFKMSRHPIYTGILAITIGYGLYTTSLFKLLLAFLLLVLFYFKSKYEEQLLIKKFPEYAAYKRKTRRFI
ncbi:DUF1295 domain-containing protein [Formosa sediminum]|uniref:DUF1295 domain-containing protein n=1 Tax=Formosa sediminum TaxID=2594004 RepID=A0A516GSV3_9FLAO|nr:methyltransferase [Formosa sediminum]QDO94602.1 DUF1295 domain-containing protein [Formosa sediminum]